MENIVMPDARATPDFLIIGAQKSGTSSLYSYISQHPEVIPTVKKEVHYFDNNFQKGDAWYRNHFPPVQLLSQCHCITGEASPYYLFHPHSPVRIREYIPGVKLIVMLRNPVDRAISHYFHVRRKNKEPLDMREAFEKEDQRIAPELKKMLHDLSYQSPAYLRFSYKKRGIYVDQIERYLELFPRQQMLILKSEDLFADTPATLRVVYDFLNINTDYMPEDMRVKNIGQYSRRIDERIYTELEEYYRPHNERLYASLGRDFGW